MKALSNSCFFLFVVSLNCSIVTFAAALHRGDYGVPQVGVDSKDKFCPTVPSNATFLYEDFYGVFKCNPQEKRWGLVYGYCISVDKNNTSYSVSGCPYLLDESIKNGTKINNIYYLLPNNISDINDFVCKPLHRHGLFCQSCIPGHGPSVFSFDLKCQKCHWYGIPLYLTLELIPITVFFMIIMTFRTSITSPPMNVFVMYCQAIANVIPSDGLLYNYAAGVSMPLLKFGLFFSGIWSLDFFRTIVPPFCVSSRVNNIHVYMLSYVSALYPLLLVLLTYTLIELHARNYRLLVWIWKPIGICSARMRRSWNPHSSVMNAFATFFLLAYTKVLFISFSFWYPRKSLNVNTTGSNFHSHTVLQMDPQEPFLGKAHAPYAVFALFLLIVFILFPALLLALYPTRLSSWCLCCCKHRRSQAIRTFVECFQGSYRDGTDGGWDLRWVSSFYLFLRIIVVAQFLGLQERDWYGIAAYNEVILCFGAVIFILSVRPYKHTWMNVWDGLVLALMGIITLSLHGWRRNFDALRYYNKAEAVWYIIFSLTTLPFICLAAYFCYQLVIMCSRYAFPGIRSFRASFDNDTFPSNSFFHRSLHNSNSHTMLLSHSMNDEH